MELWRRIGRRSAALELLGTWDQVAGRVHDRTFEMPHLLGDAQHLFRTQVASVEKDRQAVAAKWRLAEDVDMTVGEIHQILRHRSDLRRSVNRWVAGSSRR